MDFVRNALFEATGPELVFAEAITRKLEIEGKASIARFMIRGESTLSDLQYHTWIIHYKEPQTSTDILTVTPPATQTLPAEILRCPHRLLWLTRSDTPSPLQIEILGRNYAWSDTQPILRRRISASLQLPERPIQRRIQVQESEAGIRNYCLCDEVGRVASEGKLIRNPATAHAYLCDMDTPSAFQKRGYGSAILNRMLQDAKDLNLDSLVTVPTRLASQIQFYENRGFRPVGSIRTYRCDARD